MTQRSCPPGRRTAAGLWAAWLAVSLVTATAVATDPRLPAADAEDPRETPLVLAVQRAKASVVNIHSVKTAYDDESVFASRQGRKVNGMGTGIVIDGRGYIVTNHHVVAGVDSLRCTLVDHSTYEATTVAVDPERDLAIIKVVPTRELTVMPLGTSSDLMLGETVIAVGNAFGYEHTVTAGIVSQLHRDVEVNETQSYKNLIQTDASINPGNSGGPLVNLRGEVIGINVAIRAGAQRIGFAIPIDDARIVIAEMLNTERLDRTVHGLMTEDLKKAADRRLVVRGSVSASPASQAGFQPGDVVTDVAGRTVTDRVDFERALLGRKAGQDVAVIVRRDGEPKTLTLTLAASSAVSENVLAAVAPSTTSDDAWTVLGLKLATAEASAVSGTRYRGGLRVSAVRDDSPAAQNGIRPGDVLVGLHQWETVSIDNVDWVLKNDDVKKMGPIRFYIVRGRETLYGHLKTAKAN
ncbi:MAG: trypsin-like peptidase domain-containing protein [Planctomycetaceae bacterium]